MGESLMTTSAIEAKIGGTVASDRRLEASVSFGRFENDSLSWEKWSSFSQNKYLEEVEKCATPGSVAQKKAYFEAHYKKIAVRKAEQLDQKTVGIEFGGDSAGKFRGENSGFEFSNGEIVGGTDQETKSDGELGSANGDVDEPNGYAAIDILGQGSSAGRAEQPARLDSPTLNKQEEASAVGEGGTQSPELPNKLDKETERTPILKEEPVKLNTPKESRKISPLSKVRDKAKIKKKPASPVAKSAQILTTEVSKTVMSYNPLSTNRTPIKKVTGSSQPTNKVCSIGGGKRVAPKSLHMSLSMETPSPDSAPPISAPFAATRKSFIMEKMKDKEIVKRAFKTFQNNFNQLRSSVEEVSLPAKQVPTMRSENKVSSSITPRKENAGSLKAVNMDKKTAKSSPSFGLKSYERAEKSNEKLQDKSKGKRSESTRLQTKSKEEKDAEIRKLRYSHNFRATPVPGFYQGQKVSRSPLDKEGSKTFGISRSNNG